MMIDYANLIERLEDRYMDTKHMLPSPLEHEAAQAIRQLLEYINLIEKQRDELLEHLDTVERCSNDPALVAMARRAIANVKGDTA